MEKQFSLRASRVCDKISCVLAKKSIDLKSRFEIFDPSHCGLIDDKSFSAVVYNELASETEIRWGEVELLVDRFKQSCSKVCYKEFLEIVEPQEVPDKPFVSGLEWDDHQQINVLSPFEVRHLNLILTKIAYSCRLRGVTLAPYFQDYERVSGNNGTVTLHQFRKILNFVGITLAANEMKLVVKRYIKHGYTVNYIAFVSAIENIMKWFEEHGFLDCEKNFLEFYPGRIIVAEIDSLPRPEVGKADIAELFETEKASHPCLQQKNCDRTFHELMLRIKKHIMENRIRTREFFEKFDVFNRGFITKSQFHRGLDAIGVSGLHRLNITSNELENIFEIYQDFCDPERIAWSRFCDNIDEVFTIKLLDKQPLRVFESPPEEVKQLPCVGSVDWDSLSKSAKHLAQETLFRIRNIIKSRRIDIEAFFKAYDKAHKYHVSRTQMRSILSSQSILLSEMEVAALMKRYGDDRGFNYFKFLDEINEKLFCESKHSEIMKLLKLINEKKPAPCSKSGFSVIDVFAKVKGQVTRKRINVDQFMMQDKKFDEGMISIAKFRSSFSAAGIVLDECELDILCKSFEVPFNPGFVDHKLFCLTINQAFYRTNLEKQPLTVPIQHSPTTDDSLNFLTFNERYVLSEALQKLARYHDNASNMKSFFEDRVSHGIVNKDCLEKVLLSCDGLLELVSQAELDVIFKCFSLPDGNDRKFDYKNFLIVLTTIKSMQTPNC